MKNAFKHIGFIAIIAIIAIMGLVFAMSVFAGGGRIAYAENGI